MNRSHPGSSKVEQPSRFWQKIGFISEISSLCRKPKPDGSTFIDVLTLVQVMVPCDEATLYLYNERNVQLVQSVSLRNKVPVPDFLNETTGERWNNWRKEEHQPLLYSSKNPDSEYGCDDYKEVLFVPLLSDSRVLGVLALAAYDAGLLKDKNVRLASLIADQLAVSVERSNYVAAIEVKNKALEDAHRKLKAAQNDAVASQTLATVIRLSASINHQINNPLSVIVGHTQCLVREHPDFDEKIMTRLQRIEQAAMKISKVNQKLLNFDSVYGESDIDTVTRQIEVLEKMVLDYVK